MRSDDLFFGDFEEWPVWPRGQYWNVNVGVRNVASDSIKSGMKRFLVKFLISN